MKKLVYIFILLCYTTIQVSCTKENVYPNVNLPISGSYAWNFKIPHSNQTLTLNFSNKIIKLKMVGGKNGYTNEYDMIPLEYYKKDMKIIALGKGGINISKEGKYFVIFLKDIQNDKINLFKKEFKNKEEAQKFKKPTADETDNHGWNIFNKV